MTTPRSVIDPQIIRASPSNVQVDSSVRQLCPPIRGPVMIYNPDITNICYVGYAQSVTISNSTAIQPLTFVVVDGNRQLWGFCPTAKVILNVTPGGTAQAPSPAQIAQQLLAAGLATAANQTAGIAAVNNPTYGPSTAAQQSSQTAAINNPAYGPSTAANQTSQTAAINAPAYGPSTLARQIASETNIPNNMAITGIPSTVPVLMNTGNPVAANTGWSLNAGNPIQFTIGGAYELVLSGGTNTTAWATDITVTHYDSSSNQTFSEVFTVSNWGNGTGAFGCTIRGNLHGSYISITGTSAAQAWLTTLIPSNPTVTSFTPRLYAIPYSASPTPKIIPWNMSGILRNLEVVALAAGGANTDGPLAGFCGPAIISTRNRTGGGFAEIHRIKSYSIANGSGSVVASVFCPWSGSQWGVSQSELALDMRFHTMDTVNASATVAGAYDVNVTALEYV